MKPPPSDAFLRVRAGFAVALFLAAAVAYANSLWAPFVFDDFASILDNPTIRHLSRLGQVLSPPFAIGQTVGGRPILNLSLAINYAISGPQVWSYHVLNWLIHVAAGLALFGLARRTLPRWRPMSEAQATWVGFAIALLWTVHPLQTESVTYVVQRAESLMGLCYFFCLYAFCRMADASGLARNRWAAASVGACLLGMGTKEVMVSAPCLVLLYDRTFVSGAFGAAWKRHRMLYAALFATWIPLAILVIRAHGRGGTLGQGVPVAWSKYALTQFPAIVLYLKLVIWPAPQIFYYGAEWVSVSSALIPAVIVTALGAATVIGLWRNRAWGFLGAVFFAVLAPTSLIPGIGQTIAEHRMYVALAPVVALIVGALGCRTSGPNRWATRAGLMAAAITALTFVFLTRERNRVYASALTLWSDTAIKRPLNPFAHNNFGEALVRAGRTGQAFNEFEAALALDGAQATPNNNLANLLRDQGRLAEAIRLYETALTIDPGDAEAHNGLGVALTAEGRNAEAIAALQAAIRLKPDYAEARYNLGIVRSNAGLLTEAVADYQAALRLRTDFPEARLNLGNALARLGHLEEAIAQYDEALKIRPEYADAHFNKGNALALGQRWREAAAEYEETLRLWPDHVGARDRLRRLQAILGGRETQ